MKRILFLALALSACGSPMETRSQYVADPAPAANAAPVADEPTATATATPNPLPVATPLARVDEYEGSNRVVKFCDHGRAVYTIDDDNSSGLAVVQGAAECRS